VCVWRGEILYLHSTGGSSGRQRAGGMLPERQGRRCEKGSERGTRESSNSRAEAFTSSA
jgi:ribosomal protein L19E